MNHNDAGQGEVQPAAAPVAHVVMPQGNYATLDNHAAPGNDRKPPLNQPWYGIGFGSATYRLFRKAFVFSGRASRGEYWWAVVFALLATFGLGLVCGALDNFLSPQGQTPIADVASGVLSVVLFIPFMSLLFRRLHDENLSGWWWLLPSVPLVGSLVALCVAAVKSEDASVAVAWMLASLALYLLYHVASVALAVLPTKAAGARFDKPMRTVAVKRVAAGTAGENAARGR